MKPIVRHITEDDIPDYLRMAEEFHAGCPVSGTIAFDRDGSETFLRSAMDNPSMGVWVAELDGARIGICAAVVFPLYFSPKNLAAQELWWWLDPSARGSGAAQMMFKKIEEWAKTHDAAALFMVALHDANVERMAKLYGRAGFAPMERLYVKGL